MCQEEFSLIPVKTDVNIDDDNQDFLVIVEEDDLEGGDAAADIADQTLQSILTNIQTNNNSGNPDANGFKVRKC